MFVLHSYGGEVFARQALLSALSIKARKPEATVTVYTNRPSFFTPYGIDTRPVTKAEIAWMQAPLGYKHGVKIGLLLRHALENPPGTPIVYIDSDTYFRGGEAELGDRPFVMHNLDGIVGEEFYPRLNRFLIEQRAAIEASPYAGLATGYQMFNSGLLGFRVTPETIRFLHDAKIASDWLCVRLPAQYDWMEQIALGWLAQQRFGVVADPMGFEHYWGCNTEVAALLSKKSLEEIQAIAKDTAAFDTLLKEAEALRNDFWHKITTLRKKRWNRSLFRRLLIRKARKLRD